MATATFELNSADGDTDNFIMEKLSTAAVVHYRFDATEPAADAPGFTLENGYPAVRLGVEGKVWVKTTSETDIALLIATGTI
jgi:hypothetical protein